MKVISEFVVHVAELVEAEGKSLLTTVRAESHRLRASIDRMATGLTFLAVSIPLFVAGVGLLATGLLWWLETHVSRPLAASLTGLVVLCAGAACVACFRTVSRKRDP